MSDQIKYNVKSNLSRFTVTNEIETLVINISTKKCPEPEEYRETTRSNLRPTSEVARMAGTRG